jgi:hypothetical protein
VEGDENKGFKILYIIYPCTVGLIEGHLYLQENIYLSYLIDFKLRFSMSTLYLDITELQSLVYEIAHLKIQI